MRFHATYRAFSAAGLVLLPALLGLAAGCTQSRTFTIYAIPDDAKLIIDGVEQHTGGPITRRFTFTGPNDVHHVRAVRPGYVSKTQDLWPDTPLDAVVITLEPAGKRIVFTVGPEAAIVSVNNQPLSPKPVSQIEYTLASNDPDAEFIVTAERDGYEPAVRTLRGSDGPGYYPLLMRRAAETAVATRPPGTRAAPEPMRTVSPGTAEARTQARADAPPKTQAGVGQPDVGPIGRGKPGAARSGPAAPAAPLAQQPLKRDIVIETDPPKVGATIYLDGVDWGSNGLDLPGHEFKRDPAGKPLPVKVRASAPGYEGGETVMQWDDNRRAYVVPLGRRKKPVRIVTEPAGAVVSLGNKALPRDRSGAAAATITFPPTDPEGEPTIYTAGVAATNDAWEPQELKIAWDDGQQDYHVKLLPARTAKATLLRPRLSWRPQEGWVAAATRFETGAVRDTGEGPNRPEAQRFAAASAGAVPDSITVSPDGTQVLYTALSQSGEEALTSTLVLLNSDGTPGATLPGDGRFLDLTPSFTPDGARVLFTSDRGGAGALDVWSLALAPGSVPKRIAASENATLWPMQDSSPQPRLFYEAVVRGAEGEQANGSEIRVIEMAVDPATNMTLARGSRPRPSPRADSVVYTAVDPATGNRDLYLISDKDGVPLGGDPVNLTNTPDVDECDPEWSRNGVRIAFASNAEQDEAGRRNYDIFVMPVTGRDRRQVRVTHNGSWDDSPAWDPGGRAVYFRSNRGGQWGIWKSAVP